MSDEVQTLFTQKDGGFVDNNYSTSTGKLSFDIPLFTLKTDLNTTYDLKLHYHPNTIEKESSLWANEINTGLIGVGFTINTINKISIVAASTDTDYLLYFGGSLYNLTKNDTETNKDNIAYNTKPFSRLDIKYSVASGCWFVRDEMNTLYIFGKNNADNMENGTYDIKTGTYSEASSEYKNVRDLISQPGDDDIPVNSISDNTINDTLEQGVVWNNQWVGPTFNKSKQRSIITDWNLSNIYDAAGNSINFYYIQHLSNITPDIDAKQYTVSNYLYKIQVLNKSKYVESVIFNYAPKDSFEFSIDYILHERPNGMQQKFQKLRLDSLEYHSASERMKKIQFKTTLVTDNELREKLVKRQLQEISFIGGYDNNTEYQPSYHFEYYGNNDDVRPGASGFDELHNYINYETGALYGHISAITYPTGEKRTYKYQENNINIATSYYEPNCEDAQFIHTNFDYSIVVKRLPNNKTSFSALTWTLAGWKKQELLVFSGYNTNFINSPHIALTNHMIGVIDLEGYAHVYTRSSENGYTWSSSPFDKLGITYKTTDFKRSILHISDECIALCMKLTYNEWYLHLICTDDNGASFRHKRPALNLFLLESFDQNTFVSGGFIGKRFILFCFVYNFDKHAEFNLEHRTMVTYTLDYSTETPPLIMMHDKLPIIDLRIPSSGHFYVNFDVNIGGLVNNPGDCYVHGNLIEVRYQTCYQLVKYNEEQIEVLETGLEKNIFNDMSVGFICDMDSYYLTQITKYLHEPNYDSRQLSSYNLSDITNLSVNTIFCNNGFALSYVFNVGKEEPRTINNLINYNYDGETVVKATKEGVSQLLIRDNTFLAYLYEENKNVFRKGYEYFDHKRKKWNKINIGQTQEVKVSSNESVANALDIFNFLGFVLFLMFLPLGVGSIAGAIFTAVNLALFAATTVLQMVYKNSVTASLNVDCGYFGNRFINDGKTIWFRNLSQDLLTSIGSGESFQPDDSLSSSFIKGNIVTTSQQFGAVYNFIPFFTDAKILYYRKLQNGAVGTPVPIHSLARGVDDMYVNDNTLFGFKSNQIISALKKQNVFTVNKKEQVEKIGFLKNIDACCRINNAIVNNEPKILYFSDSRVSVCFEKTKAYSIPSEIELIIRGSSMRKLDCALELVDKNLNNIDKFFMISGTKYELIQLTDEKFAVISSGDIQTLFPGIEFNKIDCCFYSDSSYYLIRKGLYNIFKYNATTKLFTKASSGNTLNILQEEMNTEDLEMRFTFDVLSTYDKKKKEIALYKYTQNAMGNHLVDYCVSRTESSYDPRLGDKPTSIIEYEYETSGSSYPQGLNTAVYPKIDVYSCNKEGLL